MPAGLRRPCIDVMMEALELYNSPHITLLVVHLIIIANLNADQVFGARSLPVFQMEILRLEFLKDPLSMTLSRTSVSIAMDRSFIRVTPVIELAASAFNDAQKPFCLVVNGEERPVLF